MAYDVVVSYAREDRGIAVTLCNQLQAEGVQARIVTRVTRLDEGFAAEIAGMISMAKVLIVVMSANSNQSGQVIREVELATTNGLEILIANLDETKPTGSLGYFLSDKRWFSMKNKEVEAWETASEIRAYLGKEMSGQEDAVEKVQATINEIKNKPETETQNFKRKTTKAVLAMLAIPIFFILVIWMILSQFDFSGSPSDKDYEAAMQHIIVMQDSTLEKAIVKTLSNQGYMVEGELTEADLWELTSLKVISPDERERRLEDSLLKDFNQEIAENGLIEIDGIIESLDGLEYAKNLNALIIAGQSIQKIDALESLTSLTYLDLGGNQINNIVSLGSLKNIRVLNLNDNTIRDIGPLETLERVTDLNLSNNEIIDISSLEKMGEIKNIKLMNNKIHNIRTLGKLTSLEAIYLSGNEVDEISHLAELKKLIFLNAKGNRIISINDLSSLNKLKWLYLGENTIRDLSVLKEFESLIELGIEHNQLQNINVLEDLNEEFKMLWIDEQTYRANLELMERLEEADLVIQVIE
ncbi:hypothetical protein SANA_12200 [Gottschalkiaceae bacterium SANA]|nr:hypothetical protein SANA_12200 [Gottschalkiaceae bacterium SANA]